MLTRLEPLSVCVHFADHLEAYAELIPPEPLVQAKAEAHGIERNNFCQFHWCGKFQRKTCMVLRSLLTIDLSVSLFTRFHVSVDREDIWRLLLILFKTLSVK